MGGRGSSSGLSATNSAGGGGGGGAPMPIQMAVAPPANIQPTVQAAQAANASVFSAVDNSPYHDLYNGRNYYNAQNLTADQINATIQYLRDDKEAGTQYSMSQNMNQLMVDAANNGTAPKFNANQMYTYRHMMGAMHNLGYNVNLTRYDHGEFLNTILQRSGVRNADFSKLSEPALKKALTGKTYGEERFVSTSYNNFKNAPASSKATFMNRAVRIEYRAKAGVQAMMPGNGPGGAIGEIVLAPSQGRQNMKIVGVRVDNTVGVRKKQTTFVDKNIHQIVLTVEVD